MATVADIEPASLEVTPGEAGVFTLTVRNDGDDVEAYHLSTVDEAADYVVIEPDTLLVHPGQTGTSTATITLEHTGRWSVGELIVRFHIVPTEEPDDFLVVEAIATIQSFSDVAAVLSPPTLQGRRRAEAEIAIANAGNAHAYADVAVSAGELGVSIDRAQVALPANSTESVDLSVRARELLWRGEPVRHPFVVTVTPDGRQGISLEGTFAQLPLLPGWTFKALLGVGAAAAALLLIWLGSLFLGGGFGGESPAEQIGATQAETETEMETPSAPTTRSPMQASVEFREPTEEFTAGDSVVTGLDISVAGEVPADGLVAVMVTWPSELTLVESECAYWVVGETEQMLTPSERPDSGDECLVGLSGSPIPRPASNGSAADSQATLTFATPPTGVDGVVTAKANRLAVVEDDDTLDFQALESPQPAAEQSVNAGPYAFWMEIEVVAPSSNEEPRQAAVWVHRTLERADELPAVLDFALRLPPFADEPEMLTAGPNGDRGCDSATTVCRLSFLIDSGPWGDIDVWTVPLSFPIVDNSPDAGLIVAQGTSVSVGDTTVSEEGVAEVIRAAGAPVLQSTDTFPVQLSLQEDASDVTASVDLAGSVFSNEDGAPVAGSTVLAVQLFWPEGLDLSKPPAGCAPAPTVPNGASTEPFVGSTCVIDDSDLSDTPLQLSFEVMEAALDSGSVTVSAKATLLTFAPEGVADLMAGEDRDADWPLRWIASDAETIELD